MRRERRIGQQYSIAATRQTAVEQSVRWWWKWCTVVVGLRIEEWRLRLVRSSGRQCTRKREDAGAVLPATSVSLEGEAAVEGTIPRCTKAPAPHRIAATETRPPKRPPKRPSFGPKNWKPPCTSRVPLAWSASCWKRISKVPSGVVGCTIWSPRRYVRSLFADLANLVRLLLNGGDAVAFKSVVTKRRIATECKGRLTV